METYKQFKGLIYLLIIAGLTVFLTLQFKKSDDKPVMMDTAVLRAEREKNELKVKAGILEFQVASLQNEISDLKAKEEPIRQYYAGKKTNYSSRTANETDREFLEAVR